MENKPLKIVIELPPDKAGQLYEGFFKEALAKEEAVRLSLEFTETASSPTTEVAQPEDVYLQSIIFEIKTLLSQDLGEALKYLEQKLNRNTEAFDDWIMLSARYNRVNKAIHQKAIGFQEGEQEFAKIDTAIIFLVNGLRREQII